MVFKRFSKKSKHTSTASPPPPPTPTPTPAAAAQEKAEPQLRRQCGWYERLFVSTSNTGEPLYATYVARIEKPLDHVHPATATRVDELIDKVALLSARVGDTKTRNPYFEVTQRRTAQDVIYLKHTLDPATASRDEIREDVHTRAVQHSQETFSLEQGRLWNVGLWTAPPTSQSDESPAVFLSLTVLHLAADGLGGRFLFEALISPTMPEHITFLPGLPPTLEETIGYKLQGKTIRHLVWIAFSYLTPKPIRYRMTWAPHWPLKIEHHPSTQPTARKFMVLDGSLVPKLKAVAKANELGTVNPVVSIAGLAALFAATAPADKVNSNKRLPFHLALETPIALREPIKLKHSSCVGNFSGAHLHQAQLRRTTPLWKHAREYADSVKGTDTNSSLQFLAMSKLVPDPKSYKPTDAAPTPWDAYVLNEMKKSQPFRSSLDLVNLGAMHGPKNGRVSEVTISGTIDQVYSAFMLAVAGFVSHDADIPSQMAITLSWRKNCIPDALVATFLSNFRKMLTLMVSGRIGADITFGQVAHILQTEDGVSEWPAPDYEGAKAAAQAAAAAKLPPAVAEVVLPVAQTNKAVAEAVGAGADATLTPAPLIPSVVNAPPAEIPSAEAAEEAVEGLEKVAADERQDDKISAAAAGLVVAAAAAVATLQAEEDAAAGEPLPSPGLDEKGVLAVDGEGQVLVPVLNSVYQA
ncbi:hypothetical protein V8E36_004930 [Tilletia maclaganii]